MRKASFALITILLLMFCLDVSAAISDSNAWWADVYYIGEVYYEPCTEGSLASWGRDAANFSDDQNLFTFDSGGAFLEKTVSHTVGADFNFHITAYPPVGDLEIKLFADVAGSTPNEMIFIAVDVSDGIRVDTRKGNVQTVIIDEIPFNFIQDVPYDINLNRGTDGNIWLYVAELESGDINFQASSKWPDLNNTTGDYIWLVGEGMWDDLSILVTGGIIDVNAWRVNEYPFSDTLPAFNYGTDANLTLDFNIWHKFNNRMTVNISYSTSTTQGTGFAIVEDLNLVEDVCPSQDWDTDRSPCSWDWNIHRSLVSDGNYYILFTVSDGVIESFEAAENHLFIANDVNLRILQPIDEETGNVISNTDYNFTVKIWDDDNLMVYYPIPLDDNYFSIPGGTDYYIIIEISTEPDDYYPRQYSVKYDTPKLTDTLQPYLAPVEESGNFIFYVTDSITLSPLESVEIIVESVVPEGGGVEIQETITDSTGQATIPMIVGNRYTIEFYYDGTLVHTATITPTSTSIDFKVALNISALITPQVIIGTLDVVFEPTTKYLVWRSDGSVDINMEITLRNKTLNEMAVSLRDTNGNVYYGRTYTGPWEDNNGIIWEQIDINGGTPAFDTRHGLYVVIDVNSVDGNTYTATSIQWKVVATYRYELLYRLQLFADEFNPSGSKIITSAIAMIIIMLIVGSVAAMGIHNPTGLTLFALGLLGFFVFIGWFMLLPAVGIIFASIVFLILLEGKGGLR